MNHSKPSSWLPTALLALAAVAALVALGAGAYELVELALESGAESSPATPPGGEFSPPSGRLPRA